MTSLRLFTALLFLACPVIAAWAAEVPRFSDPAAEADELLSLMERRLALMPEVAAWKRERGQPVVDEAREREVIVRWEASAGGLGIDRAAARAFMEAQISAARSLQEILMDDWSAGRSAPPRARDLAREIRPELDRIGVDLLAAVRAVAAGAKEAPALAKFRDAMGAACRRLGVPGEFAAELAAASAGLRITASATLAGLRQAGVLRVGLTGDYAPFSEERGGELRGLDVEMAREFAAVLGVRVTFVRTTWSQLSEDLAAGRFDFAAGGISVTPERRKRADFGPLLLIDGKTPIARCADRGRFATLEEINRPDVRVVVNPGGTNERFARENFPRASLRMFPDNRTIFAEILEDRADVMITDGIEVKLQSSRHPGLCATRAEPFTRSEKAWMFPRDAELTSEVTGWLRPRVASGEVARRLDLAIRGAR